MALALGILILYIADSAIFKFSRMDFLDYKGKNKVVSSLLQSSFDITFTQG